jgi:hypothetical protein
VLVEAAAAAMYSDWPNILAPGVSPNDVSILEQSTNFRYGSRATYLGPTNENRRYTYRLSVSYVTGSHAFKVGFQNELGVRNADTTANGNVNYAFNNRVPSSLTQYATPYLEKERIKADLGLYVQDQWTFRHLTLNLGLRYDYFNGYVPAQDVPATPNGWVPARSFARVDCVPCWKDLDPRLGASYDLFGRGKTALKVSLGRYVNKAAVEIPTANNPITTSVNSVVRTWADANQNYIPDCDLGDRAANGECGGMSNQNFGGLNVTTRYADDVIRGWGARPHNWDLSTEVQHQLTSQISVTAGYYRNWFGNFTVTHNLLVTPADYSPFCITAPGDARLPGGGGYQVCGLYDVSLAKFGQVNNLVERASKYGNQTQVNDFFGVTVNTRFGSGVRLGGGLDTGRTVNDLCFAVDSPGAVGTNLPGLSPIPIPFTATTVDGQRICRVVTPFVGQTQLKLNASYPLPYDFVVSGVLLNVSGPAMTASYSATNAQIAPSLGRNLAACGTRLTCTTTATVPLIVPMTQFEARITRLDLRLTKLLRVRSRVHVQANVDAYNALNSSSIALVNVTYGSQWRLPLAVLEGRLIQFSANVTF